MTQTTNTKTIEAAFAEQVRRYRSRARVNRLLSHLVMGALVSLCASIVYALVGDFTALPLPPYLFIVIALACGAAAAAAAAYLSPLDTAAVLIRADKTLANGELSSTAYGLERDTDATIFRLAILEDAVRSLSAADPAQVLGKPRMRLLPCIPAALVVALFLSIVPLDLKSLFTPREPLDPEIVSLGADLESFAKKLEKKAQEEELARSLELSRELEQLGEDFQNQRIDQSEAAERLADVESRIAEEYGLKIQSFGDSSAQGKGGRGDKDSRTGAKGQGENGENGERQGETGGEKTPSGDRETDSLGETLDKLSQLRNGLGNQQGGEESEGLGGSGSGSGRPRGSQEGDEALGQGDASGDNSSKPGTTPERDRKGPASTIDRAATGGELKADTQIGEGDSRSLLLRALPERNAAKVPEAELLGKYEKTAESALAGEEIPLGLREYIKNYFISLGMLGTEE